MSSSNESEQQRPPPLPNEGAGGEIRGDAVAEQQDAAFVLAAVARQAVNQMLVPVSSSSSSSSLQSTSEIAVATAAAAAALAMSHSVPTSLNAAAAAVRNPLVISTAGGSAQRPCSSSSSPENANVNGSENGSIHGNCSSASTSSHASQGGKKCSPQSIAAAAHALVPTKMSSRTKSENNGGRHSNKSRSSSRNSQPFSSIPKLMQSGNDNVISSKMNLGGHTSTGKSYSSAVSSGPTVKGDTLASAQGPAKQRGIGSGSSKSSSLRRGKWTLEEEAYVARVIKDFNSGYLDAPAGTTLRTYLSEKLHCDPMRITKKFTGEACIGKRVFHPAVRTTANASIVDKAQAELEQLEKTWRERLEAQQREASKKAGRHSLQHVNSPSLGGASSDLTRTAAWLDQADLLLKSAGVTASDRSSKKANVSTFTLEEQIENVKRLLSEGPIIQQSSSKLVQNQYNPVHSELAKRKVSECGTERYHGRVTEDDDEVEGKKVRKSTSRQNLNELQLKGREEFETNDASSDAEALVGFINAVRRERALI